jgi:hypothetical protein
LCLGLDLLHLLDRNQNPFTEQARADFEQLRFDRGAEAKTRYLA